MTILRELMEPLDLVEWKGEINGSDGLVGIDGNYKVNGIGTLELTEVAEFMEQWHGIMGKWY